MSDFSQKGLREAEKILAVQGKKAEDIFDDGFMEKHLAVSKDDAEDIVSERLKKQATVPFFHIIDVRVPKTDLSPLISEISKRNANGFYKDPKNASELTKDNQLIFKSENQYNLFEFKNTGGQIKLKEKIKYIYYGVTERKLNDTQNIYAIQHLHKVSD